jgi:hypothetical protein
MNRSISGISGRIECKDVSDSRALRKFTEKQISNWIRSKFSEAYRKPIFYFVELRRQGSGHIFNCRIQVSLENQTWVGFNYKKEIHQALIHSLHQMIPQPARI